MSAEALLSITNLACERGGLLLFSGLGFELKPGERLQIRGPNGAGKSTLLKVLAGLSSQFEGDIRWHHTRPECIYIGHLPGIKSILTPLENLRWYFPRHADDALCSALAETGLKGYEHQQCMNLSAGQQRRVALARLYLTSAGVWLLDEPFTAIDQSGVVQIERLLEQHTAKGGAVILTTHHQLGISSGIIDLASHLPELS